MLFGLESNHRYHITLAVCHSSIFNSHWLQNEFGIAALKGVELRLIKYVYSVQLERTWRPLGH